jgi:uroporphyrinogen decarboxylase
MTSHATKSLLSVLGGTPLHPPPIWLMRQAGRYLPEYRALRAEAGSFLSLCFDPEKAARVTLQPIERFGFDAAILFADILLVPMALGQKLWFEEGEGPRLAPVTNATELDGLDITQISERLAPIYETVQRVKDGLDEKTAFIGFAGAPWTVATYMIAGRGTPNQAPAKLKAYQDPGFVRALMDVLVEATIDYLDAQIAAGCEVIQLFDTWAGGLPPALIDELVIMPTQRIVTGLKSRQPQVPIIGFPRGLGTQIGRYASETGIDGLGLGTGESITVARKLVGPKLALQGNLDPLALLAGGDALEMAVKQLLKETKGTLSIFNLGHGILPQTPPEHVARLIELVRDSRVCQ